MTPVEKLVRSSVTTVTIALAGCGLGRAAESPPKNATTMFRGGPAHAGVYAAADGRTLVGIAWHVETEGDVISSPAVDGDVVYVGSGDGFLYALDRRDGKIEWRTDAGSPIASSPAVGGGLVYFGTREGEFHAVDARTGRERWHLATGADLPLPWGHESGDVYTSSPAYVSGLLVFGAGDGGVYTVDAASGRIRWRAKTGGRVRSSPAVANGRVYVGSADGCVYAFDLASGALRWRYETEGAHLESAKFGFDRRTVQSSPAVSDGTVFVGARDGFLYAIDAETGTLRWRFDHKISWVNTSPAVSDGVVYAGSSDGQFVQAVDGATGNELWRTKTAVTWSSPAVAGDLLYSGDGAGRLDAIDRRTGKLLWSFRTASQVFSSPVPTGDLVLVGSTDGSIYALRVGAGPAVRRAVFFDSAYVRSASTADAAMLASYFEHRGYEVVNESALAAFLRARLSDRSPSVVVFAIDHLPPSVLDSVAERSLVRQYLEAGGKIVWPGPPPLLFPRDPKTGQTGGLATVDWTAASRLLGVSMDAAIFDRRGVRPTPDGVRWGLPARWRDGWGIAPDSGLTVLGRDEWGLASSWVRSFGGGQGTGFVRVPADSPLVLYLVAEYRPGGGI